MWLGSWEWLAWSSTVWSSTIQDNLHVLQYVFKGSTGWRWDLYCVVGNKWMRRHTGTKRKQATCMQNWPLPFKALALSGRWCCCCSFFPSSSGLTSTAIGTSSLFILWCFLLATGDLLRGDARLLDPTFGTGIGSWSWGHDCLTALFSFLFGSWSSLLTQDRILSRSNLQMYILHAR